MTHEKDLVVIGYGAAGVAAAITAARSGLRVALVEKQSKDTHFSSTRMSGGLVMGAADIEATTTYLDACSGGMVPSDVSRAWAERAVWVQDFMRSIGIESAHMAGGWYPKVEGFSTIEVFAPLPHGTDPATIAIELPPPGELAFRGPFPSETGNCCIR